MVVSVLVKLTHILFWTWKGHKGPNKSPKYTENLYPDEKIQSSTKPQLYFMAQKYIELTSPT